MARRSRNSSSRSRTTSPEGCWKAYRGVPGAGDLACQSERHQLAHAVFDVQAHPAERLHERFDFEGFLRPCAEESQESGSQRRLDQGVEARFDFRRVDAATRDRYVLHSVLMPDLPDGPAAVAHHASGNIRTGTPRSAASSPRRQLFDGRGSGRAVAAGTFNHHVRKE